MARLAGAITCCVVFAASSSAASVCDPTCTIDRQTIDTQVLVESGETLVIGGLITKQLAAIDSGVPGFRCIPLLGFLFEGKNRRERFVETVIYITPYINDPSFFLPENISRDVDEKFSRKVH